MGYIKRYTTEEILAMSDEDFKVISDRVGVIRDLLFAEAREAEVNKGIVGDVLFYGSKVGQYALIASSIAAVGYFAYKSVQYVVDKNYQMVNEVRKEQRNEQF